MTDLSVREAVAMASFEAANPGHAWATLIVLAQRPFSPERTTRDTHFAIAAAALAAVAAHPGLAEAIRVVLARGAYQMPDDTLPYETQANAVSDAVLAWIGGGV